MAVTKVSKTIKNLRGGNANSNGNNTLNDMMSSRMPLIIAIGIILLLFVIIIIYISFVLKSSNLQGKRLIGEPKELHKLTSTDNKVEAVNMPLSVVGREYTYSFWLYIDSFEQTPGRKPQMIMYRGSDTTLADANPIVMLDGTTNKLYIVIKTEGSDLSTKDGYNFDTDLKYILERSYFLDKNITLRDTTHHKHLIMTVDYVPLQRWVNIAFVIDNKILTIFLDGEIYSVKTTDEFKMMKQPEYDARQNVIDYNLVISSTSGNLKLGKFLGSDVPVSYISNLEYFNYAISLNDIKRIYKMGPFPKSWLSFLGLNSYGLQWPVYKIADAKTS